MKEHLERVKGLADDVAQASQSVKKAIDLSDANLIREAKDRLQFATGQLTTELYLLGLEMPRPAANG